MLSSIIIGTVLRKNAIEQHAPSFKYEDTDITAIKTKGGEVLPLDILQDNIGDFLGTSLLGGRKVAYYCAYKKFKRKQFNAAGGESANAYQ